MAHLIEPIHSKNGKTYWIESGDTMYEGRLIHGQYQSTNWDFAQTIVQDWQRCIDIGSNNACNAVHYANRFNTVECFEPTPLAQTLWANTVRDNSVSNVTLHTSALGETPRRTQIITHPRNGGHNHLQHFDKNPRSRGTTKATVDVDVRTLDSYKFTQVGFIKIDVEGYELFVLQGAMQTITTNRPVLQLELVEKQCRKFNYARSDIADLFDALNYRCCSKINGWIDLRTHKEGRGEMDLFFVPQEKISLLPPHLALFV
jgi:FkbM family methyltransferase